MTTMANLKTTTKYVESIGQCVESIHRDMNRSEIVNLVNGISVMVSVCGVDSEFGRCDQCVENGTDNATHVTVYEPAGTEFTKVADVEFSDMRGVLATVR